MKRLFLLFNFFILYSSALPFHRDSLDNGLILLTYEDHRLPVVDIAFVCRAGAVFEPKEKAGIAQICAQMLLRGTENLSADSIATILEFLGADYHAGADFDHSYIYLRLLAKDLSTALDLLTDIVLKPAFPEDELIRVRDEALIAARRAYDFPTNLVTMEFDRLLFAEHRYSLPVRGDTATIPKITSADLHQFYRTHFVPNNCFLVIVGEVDYEAVKQEIIRRFSSSTWQSAPVPIPAQPDLKPPEKTRIKLITRPEMNQTYIHFGHPGISASAPDLIPVRLMSYILGGPPLSSRIGLAVREHAGLAYDVRCWFDRRTLTGAFRATVQTAKPKEAIQKMFAEISRMQKHGVTEAELKKAHNYFTGSFPLTYSSNQGKLEQIKNLELYRYGKEWLETYPQKIKVTTIEQVNQAAAERLKPGQYIMVIMGNVTKADLDLPDDVEWLD